MDNNMQRTELITAIDEMQQRLERLGVEYAATICDAAQKAALQRQKDCLEGKG